MGTLRDEKITRTVQLYRAGDFIMPVRSLGDQPETSFLYCIRKMYFTVGTSRTGEASNHAPGSPKHTAANDANDADASVALPLTSAGRYAQINTRDTNSATPAPSTYPTLVMPCTALRVTIESRG